MLRALRQEKGVAFAELDYAVQTADAFVPNDPEWPAQWGPSRIGAPVAWDVTTGTSDVVVAVLDTGVRLGHPDLAQNLWTNPGEIPGNGVDDDANGKVDDFWGWHFFHEWAWHGTEYDFVAKEDNQVHDENGHGTHVAGITGARMNNGVGIAGVAGGSRVMPVKVLDQDGYGWYSDMAQGIVYAVDSGAEVINLSVGGSVDSSTLRLAVDYARDRAVLIVAAAGNTEDNHTAVLFPAAYEDVLAVTATDQDDARAGFSNHGPEVDVAGPGVHVYSTWYTYDYFIKSGTSMAAPHVSGLAALMWSARPELTAAQVTRIITSTAADVNSDTHPGWDEYLGWGRIDAGRALSRTTHTGELRLSAADASLPVSTTTFITASVPFTSGVPTPVHFSALGGTVSPDATATADGTVTTTLTAGPAAQTALVTAETEALTGTVYLRLLPGPVVSATLAARPESCIPTESAVLTLQASDLFDNLPLDGTTIAWSAEGGTVSPARSVFGRGKGKAVFTPSGVRETAMITASWSGGLVTTTVDIASVIHRHYLPIIRGAD